MLLHAYNVFSQTQQDTTWKVGGATSLTFSQVTLRNWSAGGQSSISANVFGTAFAHYRKDKANWENTLDIGYGIIRQDKKRIVKTDDKIDLSSKYGRKAAKNWFYSVLFNFRTQMTPGYEFPNDTLKVKISDFLAPGYIITSIGMDYNPNAKFTLFLSPVTGKTTLVLDQTLANKGAFGVEEAVQDTGGNIVEPGKNVRQELGGYIKIRFTDEIMKNINLQTKIDLFSNYLKDPQNIDINWELIITMKVNKYISANLSTHLIYDNDIDIAIDEDNDGIPEAVGPRTQFKEVLGIGISYEF